MSGNCDPSWPGSSPTIVDIVGKPNKIGNKFGFCYDPSAFADVMNPNSPGDCRQSLGNSGFNNLRGPGVFNWDFGLFRDFAIKERLHIQFRAEVFNFTNTPHFANPDNSLGDANSIDQRTGRVIDPGSFMTLNNGVTDLAREGIDERQFRFGLRIQF